MKVVCINSGSYNITDGKIYEAEEIFNDLYYIIDDSGQKEILFKSRFRKIEEVRDEKIEQILE